MNKFDVFSYQISPDTTIQTKLFESEVSIEDLIKNKNKYFNDIFEEELNFYSSRHKLNYKIEYIDNEFILIRLANKKL